LPAAPAAHYRDRDGSLHAWDAKTCEHRWAIRQDGQSVSALAFSPDGSRIVTSLNDGTVCTWDATTGGRLASIVTGGRYVKSAVFSPGSTLIAISLNHGPLQLRDAFTGELRATLGESAGHVAFSPDGTPIAGPYHGHSPGIWETATGTLRVRLSDLTHYGRVRDIIEAFAFSPDGAALVTIFHSGVIRTWDVAFGEHLAELRPGHLQDRCTVLSPDASQLAVTSYDATTHVNYPLCILDAATGSLLVTTDDQSVDDLAFSPDGRRIATSNYNGTIRIRDTITGDLLATFLPLPGDGYATLLPAWAVILPQP
jgi:WD40 repeat protein